MKESLNIIFDFILPNYKSDKIKFPLKKIQIDNSTIKILYNLLNVKKN